MEIRVTLVFDGDVLLGDFVPDEKNRHLHLTFQLAGCAARLFLSEEDLHRLSNPAAIAHLPKASQMKHLVIRFLTLSLTLDIDPETEASLRLSEMTPKIRRLLARIEYAARQTHLSLRDAFQDFFKLGSYKPEVLRADDMIQYLKGCNARWLDGHTWRPLIPNVVFRQFGYAIALVPLGERDWLNAMPSLINGTVRTPIWHVLLNASCKSLYDGNVRIAVIEAVMAIESALRSMLEDVFKTKILPTEQQLQWRKEVILSMKLTRLTRESLNLLKRELEIGDDTIANILELISLRNNFVHANPAYELHEKQTMKLLEAAQTIIVALERIFQGAPGSVTFTPRPPINQPTMKPVFRRET